MIRKNRRDFVWNLEFTDRWYQEPRANSAGSGQWVGRSPRPRSVPRGKVSSWATVPDHRAVNFKNILETVM